MEGYIAFSNRSRAIIRCQEGDFFGGRRCFTFDPQYGHTCMVVGMPVTFDVGKDLQGRMRAENIRIVEWLYPSPLQTELIVINWGPGGGTGELACGCHASLYRDQFLTDDQYIDDPAILCNGTKLVADIVKRLRNDGQTAFKATNIEILIPEGGNDANGSL